MNKFLFGASGLIASMLASQAVLANPFDSHHNHGPLDSYLENDLGQVTSVSQLSDVFPTDWAFQAVQSLVERYGCIAGYPDGTFRGNRKATRYELAAALNACLDQISDRFATKADLDMAKALQEEFAAELATLRGRVDGLEARTATLEAQQFSTTTRLEGSVILAAQFGDQLNVAGPVGDSRASVISEVEIAFNTSFNGNDLLQVALETGNGGNGFIGAFLDGAAVNNPGLPAPASATPAGIVNLGGLEYRGTGPEVEITRLAYEFSPFEDFNVTVGPVVYPSDFVDANSYANDPGSDFSSGFFINNALLINDAIDDPGGAGFGFDYNVNGGPVSLRAGYVALAGNEAIDGATICAGTVFDCDGGLFGDPQQAVAEIEYADEFGEKNNFAIRLQYAYVDTFDIVQNVLGVNAEVTFGQFGLFGRYGISIDPEFANADLFPVGDNNIQTWQAGVGVNDLLIPGSLLAFAAGQPFIVPGTTDQTNYEGFFRFPVNDNITVTPTIQVITDALNTDQDAIVQGVIRTTFSF